MVIKNVCEHKDDLYFCYLANYVECGASVGQHPPLSGGKYGECMCSCRSTKDFKILTSVLTKKNGGSGKVKQ